MAQNVSVRWRYDGITLTGCIWPTEAKEPIQYVAWLRDAKQRDAVEQFNAIWMLSLFRTSKDWLRQAEHIPEEHRCQSEDDLVQPEEDIIG